MINSTHADTPTSINDETRPGQLTLTDIQ